MSLRSSLVQFVMRRTVKKHFARAGEIAGLREYLGKNPVPTVPDTVSVIPQEIAGVPCEWVTTPKTDQGRVLLYFHGGGYVLGGLDMHRDLTWRLADAAGMRVLAVDYRVAPEAPFPAALDDAIACLGWLLDEGYDPASIAIGGDSAGGGLALATLVHARYLGYPRLACGVLLSPWVDLALKGDSLRQHARSDAILSPEALHFMAGHYLGERDRTAPLASPLYADLAALPPLYVQVGDTEVLLSDSERLVEKLKAAGNEAVLEVWPGMPHVWQAFASRIPEGRAAIERLGEYLARRTSASPPPVPRLVHDQDPTAGTTS